MKRGFTLVELIVAMGVGIAVSAMALIAVSSGFRSWTRLAAGGVLLETDRGFLRFERDVSSALPLPDAPFAGDASQVTIPLERGGALCIVSWTAAPDDRLVRRERDYLFAREASFDGRAEDGTSIQFRTESYRIPAPARFAYHPAPDASAEESITADSPTNLPYAVSLSSGGFSRFCPVRLAPPPTP